jgi:hypothetical protein
MRDIVVDLSDKINSKMKKCPAARWAHTSSACLIQHKVIIYPQ